MNAQLLQEMSIPNPALAPFQGLIGSWTTTGTHLYIPNTVLRGSVTFEWLEGGAFLKMRDYTAGSDRPSAVAIFGSNHSNAMTGFCMLYFDERGVSRQFEVALTENGWTWWRNAPGFFQRFELTRSDDGNTLIGISRLSKDDGKSWEQDLELTYRRIT